MKNTIISIILFTIGLCVLLYPMVSNYMADQLHSAELDTYAESMQKMPNEVSEEEWQKALDYNASLIGQPVKDPFIQGSGMALPDNYKNVLNVDGIMGYIEIPKINVKLPIYHSVSEEVLQKGVGHIEGTALPIGTDSSHSVLSGHTGLPSAKLFTDLIDLVEGDQFYIHVLGKELVYQVDQINVVDPDDISKITTAQDQDYITLITCTPYGVNSHRLLVRGERVNRFAKMIRILKDLPHWIYYVLLGLSVLVLFILAMICIAEGIKKLKHKRSRARQRKKAGMAGSVAAAAQREGTS